MSLDAGFWRRRDIDEGDNGRLPKEAENNLLFPLGLSSEMEKKNGCGNDIPRPRRR